MSQNRSKHAIYKAILHFDHDINQLLQRFKFDMDQVLTLLSIDTVWI